MSSPAHEHFGQYKAMVAVVRHHLPELQVLLLDINCQVSKHLQRRMPTQAGDLRFYICGMHAKAGHNLECQLLFNSMFGQDLGRGCFGEGIEQLWVSPWKIWSLPACFHLLQHIWFALEGAAVLALALAL
jgi:hypothetical protein